MHIPLKRLVICFAKLLNSFLMFFSNNSWIHVISCQLYCKGEYILSASIVWIHFYVISYKVWNYHHRNSFTHQWLNQQLFLILLSKVNITFAKFVIDYLSMVLLLDAYSDPNAITSPAPLRAKYLSTDKEVKFGNK